MKQTLLLFLLLFTFSFAQAQLAMRDDCSSCRVTYTKTDIKVYPNPVTNFIAFQNEDGIVRKVVLYNLVGRRISKFVAVNGKNTYDVSDLARGMYLIQLVDGADKIITTKRINKRWGNQDYFC